MKRILFTLALLTALLTYGVESAAVPLTQLRMVQKSATEPLTLSVVTRQGAETNGTRQGTIVDEANQAINTGIAEAQKHTGLPRPAIIGIAIGVAVLVVILLLSCCCCVCGMCRK